MQDPKKQRLGRGLDALLGPAASASVANEMVSNNIAQGAMPLRPAKLRLSKIQPNSYQPRQHFDQAQLHELAQSIKTHGVLQPILVRKLAQEANVETSQSEYEIIAGERRWRAAQLAGFHEIPVLITEANNQQSLEVAILENTQREDLNAIEQAQGYQRLSEEFGYSNEQIAQRVGKSRSAIANTMRLLQLPKIVQGYIEQGQLSAGHARALINRPDAASLALTIIEKGLSVREVERLTSAKTLDEDARPTPVFKTDDSLNHHNTQIASPYSNSGFSNSNKQNGNPDLLAVAKDMSASWGTKIQINERDSKSGQLILDYYSLEQLDLMIECLMRIDMKTKR